MLKVIGQIASIALRLCLIFLVLVTGGIVDFIDIDELI
jgi:hypothetical protein